MCSVCYDSVQNGNPVLNYHAFLALYTCLFFQDFRFSQYWHHAIAKLSSPF